LKKKKKKKKKFVCHLFCLQVKRKGEQHICTYALVIIKRFRCVIFGNEAKAAK
jgi:hypothetical protein